MSIMSYKIVCLHTIGKQYLFFFFFNDTATTEIYTLSLHDALPICLSAFVTCSKRIAASSCSRARLRRSGPTGADRKSTRLNSSHSQISYAVFCLKKKKKIEVSSLLLGRADLFNIRVAPAPPQILVI